MFKKVRFSYHLSICERIMKKYKYDSKYRKDKRYRKHYKKIHELLQND